MDTHNLTGYAQVLEELQGTNLMRVYTYGLSLISQRLIGNSTNGTVTDTYTYDAYGTLINFTGTTPNNYLYCGEQWDNEIGLYFRRARYMNPNTGRFWTMDTDEGNSEDPLSLHKYLYCQGNPINGIDPSGHEDLISLNLTMAQWAGLAVKTFNVVVNIKASINNYLNGLTAQEQGRNFDAALDFTMSAANATAALASAFAPLPPGSGPALAGASASGIGSQAVRVIGSNPALEKWFVANALPYASGTLAGLTGYTFAMAQGNSGPGQSKGDAGSGTGRTSVRPGRMLIGFMTKDGKLIGRLVDPSVGHDALASELGVYDRAKSGNVIAISVGKLSDGTKHAFGSSTFPPPGGVMSDAMRELAKNLIE